jgi:hypothetical protein
VRKDKLLVLVEEEVGVEEVRHLPVAVEENQGRGYNRVRVDFLGNT